MISVNPLPTLVLSDRTRISATAPWPPRAARDRASATIGRARVGTKGIHSLGPTARRSTRPQRLLGAPHGAVVDVPTSRWGEGDVDDHRGCPRRNSAVRLAGRDRHTA